MQAKYLAHLKCLLNKRRNILCDGNGKIVAVNLRGKALGRKLKEIYGE